MAKLLKDYRFWGLIWIIVVVFIIFMLLKFSGFNFTMEGLQEGVKNQNPSRSNPNPNKTLPKANKTIPKTIPTPNKGINAINVKK